MYHHLITILLLLFLAVPGPAMDGHAHSVRFERLTDGGAPYRGSVSHIFQDRQGFIWLATREGLEKYDGYHLVSYKHQPFNPNSISGNAVEFVTEDQAGYLWVIADGVLNRFDRHRETFRRYPAGGEAWSPYQVLCDTFGNVWVGTLNHGLGLYNPVTDGFTIYSHNPDDPRSLGGNRVSGLIQSLSGDLWVTCVGGGLNRFDPENERFERYLQPSPGDFDFGPHNIPRNRHNPPLIEDENGRLWIITVGGGLIRFDTHDRSYTQFLNDPTDAYSLSHNVIRSIFRDSRGLIWLAGGDGGLDVYYPRTGIFRHYRSDASQAMSLPDNRLKNLIIVEDDMGDIWFGGTGFGLFTMTGPGKFTSFRHRRNDPHSLVSDDISWLLLDRSQNLWIGGRAGGVGKYSHYRRKFRMFRGDAENPDLFSGRYLSAIAEDSVGNLWLGSKGQGLIYYDPREGKVLKRYQGKWDDPSSLSGNQITAILADGQDHVWIGTTAGLNRVNRNSDLFQYYRYDYNNADSLSADHVTALYRDPADRLWVGTRQGGVNLFLSNEGRFRRYALVQGDPRPGADQVRAMVADGGDLWIAHEGVGLHRLNPESGAVETFSHNLNQRDSLSHNGVSSLVLDRDGDLWAGTFGGGLNRKQRDRPGFQHVGEAEGLPSGAVFGLGLDRDGRLWVCMKNALAVLEPSSMDLRVYDPGDGLITNSYDNFAFAAGADNRLYFAGEGGFNMFQPHTLSHNPHPPNLAITAVNLMGRPHAGEQVPGDRLRLSYSDNIFSIQFAALDFTYPDKNRYAYILEGFDPTWIDSGRNAVYTNLDGGVYTFRVKGANNDEVWNEEGVTLEIEIVPPFWRTWWFHGLEVLVGLLVVVLIFRRQRGQLQKQKQEALLALDHRRKTEELEYARRIQVSMLPEGNLDEPRFEVYGKMRTATEVGGDYYDFCPMEDGRWCVLVGDATGHGFAAGLVVGMTKMGAAGWERATVGLDQLVKDLNHGLKKSLRERAMGMGLGVSMLDPETGKCELAFAGMPFPYHFHHQEGRLETLEMRGFPLGFMRVIKVETRTLTARPGDSLIFLSDGLAERFNRTGEMWGNTRLETVLTQACSREKCAAAIVDEVFRCCDVFAEDLSNDDDMTMLVIRFKPV